MPFKITAPAGALVHGPVQAHVPGLDLWWVHGVLYVDLDAQPEAVGVMAYFRRKPAFAVETVDTIPGEYTADAASLRQQSQHGGFRNSVALQDAGDPGRLNYPSAVTGLTRLTPGTGG